MKWTRIPTWPLVANDMLEWLIQKMNGLQTLLSNGSLKGEKGDKGDPGVGEDGPPGRDGTNGKDGADGAPGPNVVSTSTGSPLIGLIKGDGTHIALAAAGLDYAMAIAVYKSDGTHFDDPNTTQYELILTQHANCPNGSPFWFVRTCFYVSLTGHRKQIAFMYATNAGIWERYFDGTSWSAWVNAADSSTAFAPASGSPNYAPASGSPNYAPSSGIAESAIASGSETGNATKLVTGTAGANGNFPAWDANGNVGDSGNKPADFAAASGSPNYAPASGSANYAPASGSANYATAAQGTKADNALPAAGGTLTGNLTITKDSPRFFANRANGGSGQYAGIDMQDNGVVKGAILWDFTNGKMVITLDGTTFHDLLNSGGFSLEAGANVVLDTVTGTKWGTAVGQKQAFWGATPIVKPGAFTQTYATADKTIAALTSAAMTNNTGGSVSTTLAAITAGTSYAQADMVACKNAIASIYDQLNKLRNDHIDGLQGFTALVDDLQAEGLIG